MAACRKHKRPTFGCAGCVAASAPPSHVTPKGNVIDAPWVCPRCRHKNRAESMTCRRPLEGQKTTPRVVPLICGYDRRLGIVDAPRPEAM